MFVIFLAGGIASGKSTVLRELAARGARVADLDVISREVTAASSAVNAQIAEAFGPDVLDGAGSLKRSVLAERAFASDEGTRLLESIVHPAIRKRLDSWLAEQESSSLCVVEIPLLDRVEDLIARADEVLCVVCPLELRRERARGRGMDARDFDARVSKQTTDDYLVAHATTVLHNGGSEEELLQQIDEWWQRRSEDHREFLRAAATIEE